MAKTPLDWSENPSAEANLVTYNSASTRYNSTTVTYSSIVIGDQGQNEKVPSSWAIVPKTADEWAFNPDYDDNEWSYDGASAYDSASRTYDGVTTGENSLNTAEPVLWSEA